MTALGGPRPRRASVAGAVLLLAGWWLVEIGDGVLAAPPVGSAAALDRWYRAIGPATAAIALARVAALALVAWLVLSLLLVTASGLRPASMGLRRMAQRIAPAALHQALAGLTGLTVLAGATATTVVAAAPPAAATDDGGVAVLRRTGGPGTTAVLRPAHQPRRSDAAVPAPVAPVPATDADVWLVEAGDSCWHIAAEVLAERHGAPADDAAVERYWRRLVAANGSRFVTGDPDLLLPGQQLVLPA